MNERNIIETQPERTDLPLIVIPVIVESMIEPFAANFPLLHDIARIRMHCDFTLDTDTILERTKDAEAVTEITYEPWHWRYVGPENAALIQQSGLCLEDAVAVLQKLAAGEKITG